jgi:hypothetical protein
VSHPFLRDATAAVLPGVPSVVTYATETVLLFILSPSSPSKDLDVPRYLYEWREETLLSILGEDVLVQHGADLFMGENVVTSIVDCLTLMRITSLSNLETETGWPLKWIERHGGPLLDLILQHYPVPDDEPITLNTPC